MSSSLAPCFMMIITANPLGLFRVGEYFMERPDKSFIHFFSANRHAYPGWQSERGSGAHDDAALEQFLKNRLRITSTIDENKIRFRWHVSQTHHIERAIKLLLAGAVHLIS